MEELASQEKGQHIAVCPSAGIGHLVPFLRLASMLSSSSKCTVTLITLQPTLTLAETTQITTFLTCHPEIHSLDIHLPCVHSLSNNNSNSSNNNNHNASTTTKPADGPDPFFLRYAAVSHSAHHIAHHLSTLSPLPSAAFCDVMLASGFGDALATLSIANYLLVTTSARFFSLTTYLPYLGRSDGVKLEMCGNMDEEVEIPPGLSPIPKSSIPPPFFNPNHVFTKMLLSNSSSLHNFKGIVINTFDFFEFDTISALRSRKILSDLPPIFLIGPLKNPKRVGCLYPGKEEKGLGSSPVETLYPAWLDEQLCKSVIYVAFGSRTSMSKDQIRELGDGLRRSGVRFLWAIKISKVDKEVEEEEVRELLGEEFFESIEDRGLVVQDWVDQEAILDHPAVGGFVTHCGWNSIMEAAQRGMPVLAWPQHGDQKVNAGVVEKAGLGVWVKGWGWIGERLVKGEEIGEKIKEVMTSEELRKSAKRVGEEASKAWEFDGGCGGSSLMCLRRIISDISDVNDI